MNSKDYSIVLPAQDFFIPSNDFLKFLKNEIGYKTVIECGCGNGLLSSKLNQLLGEKIISIDISQRDTDFFYILDDATTFNFPKNSIVIIARPNRGDWILKTIENALKTCDYIIYIGLEKHLEEDIYSLNFPYTEIYKDAGRDKEIVYKITKNTSRNMKTKYYLVEYMAAKNTFFKSWFEDEEDRWINFSGSYMPKSKKDKILEEKEIEDIHDLDWKKASIYKTDSRCGWLSRDGKFIGCSSQDHDLIADLILNETIEELEKQGWVRIWIDETFICQIRLSAEQRNYLLYNGYKVEDND
jgi:hypothetical protein